jgi:hypothetical protein
MAIWEKFKYCKRMIFRYLSTRFGILKFAVFTILLCLLGLTEIPEGRIFAENFIFILVSLFAFRLLDDLWSFHLDRIHHPERTYLLTKNMQIFIVFTVIVFSIYLVGLFLFSRDFAIAILVLFLVSNGLYLLFFRKKSIITIIPLLKYPVLIWCISGFSMSPEVLLLSAGAFFMMLTSDYIDENKSSSTLKYKILLILITGILIFQPWNIGFNMITDVVFISLTILLIAFTSMDEQPIFPVVVFPVLHIFDLIISL